MSEDEAKELRRSILSKPSITESEWRTIADIEAQFPLILKRSEKLCAEDNKAMDIIRQAAKLIESDEQTSLLWWMSEIRQVSGDHGKRMLPQLVDYIQQLKINADRYEKLRKLNPRQFDELWQENMRGKPFDELVDKL